MALISFRTKWDVLPDAEADIDYIHRELVAQQNIAKRHIKQWARNAAQRRAEALELSYAGAVARRDAIKAMLATQDAAEKAREQ
jgi:hypothetical protein